MLLELLSRPLMRTSKRVIEIDHLSPTALSPLRTASLYPASKPQRETIEDRLDRIGPEAEATEADQPVDKGEDFFCKRSGSFNLALRIARKNLEAIVVRRTPEKAVKVRNLLEKSLREVVHDQKEGGK
jgi:hypothetical protein